KSLSDVTPESPNRAGAGILVSTHHFTQVFGIELFGQRRRSHQIAKHDGKLAPFGVGWYPRVGPTVALRVSCPPRSSRYRARCLTPCRLEDLQAVAGNRDPEVF